MYNQYYHTKINEKLKGQYALICSYAGACRINTECTKTINYI